MSALPQRRPHLPSIDEIAARAAGPGASPDLLFRIRNAIIEMTAGQEDRLRRIVHGPKFSTAFRTGDLRDVEAAYCEFQDGLLFV